MELQDENAIAPVAMADAAAVEEVLAFPAPVGANGDVEEGDDGDGEPKKKIPKRKKNFELRCVGAEISDDCNIPTRYNFEIKMEKNRKYPDRENIVYEVDIEQGDFQNAYTKWSRKIKTGFLYCPGNSPAFVQLINMAILDYEDGEDGEDDEVGGGGEHEYKERLYLKNEMAIKIDGKAYFISGQRSVYIFTPDTPGSYVRKLEENEIANLPVKIVYEGKEKSYENNHEEALIKFLELIRNYNSVQRPQHQSSFVNSCLINLKAELYNVVEDHRVGVDYCSTTGGGKSMTLAINDKIYRGKESKGLIAGCTEAGLRRSLSSGIVGRIDEIDKKDAEAVTKLMKPIWQPDGGIVQMGNKDVKVCTSVLICTNLTPQEIMDKWKISFADLTKYSFNWVGETPMELVREDFQEVLDYCLLLGLELNKFKPVLLGLGYKILRNRIPGSQLAKFDPIVGSRSQRFTQGLVHLEKFSELLVEMAENLGLPAENIPNSLLPSPVQFSCLLKSKDLLARQAERKPSDLISEVIQMPEEARKCLVIISKGRKGVGIITNRLKESPTFKPWMLPILHKMDLFDSFLAGERVRGRRISSEDLEDLYAVVNDLLTITAEKVLALMAIADQRMKKRTLKSLRDDVLQICAPELEKDDKEMKSQEEEDEEDPEDPNDPEYFPNDGFDIDAPGDMKNVGDPELDIDNRDMDGPGDIENVGGPELGVENRIQFGDGDYVEEFDNGITVHDGIYKCTICKPAKGKKFQWKTKKWVGIHVKKCH